MADDQDRVTIWASSDLVDRLDERVAYGPPEHGSRSSWTREAIRYRMVVEDALDRAGYELPEDDDRREAYLRDVAQAGIDAVGPPGETD